MTTLIPNSQASGAEAYEDMFKEITRKLYGEEATHGLHTPATHNTTGTTTSSDIDRSFSSLLSDRNLTSTDFDNSVGMDNLLKNDDHLTAFGLALMQNGFPAPNAILNSHTFQQISKQNQTLSNNMSSASIHGQNSALNAVTQEKCAQPQRPTELNAWNSKSESYQQSQKNYKSKKQEMRDNSNSNEDLKSTNNLNSNGNTAQTTHSNGQGMLQKRYNCSNCPYSTDRRDLFTRHENIHKEDKPFHCYICLKQFNRADHVKKHFLRMHRGLNYDISRTKRSLPQQKAKKNNTSNASFYNNTNHMHHASTPSSYHSNLHTQQMEQQSQPSIIDQANQHLDSAFQSTDCGTTSNQQNQSQQLNVKMEKNVDKSPKKSDKRFVCCYCSWSGNDNWGLKRHLNTHTKPFVCILCDYKAARSERLATHVFKVHNKKVCTKCNYLAENQNEYDAHVNDVHANDSRSQRFSSMTNNLSSRSTVNQNARNFNTNNQLNGNNSFNSMPNTSSINQTFGSWRSMGSTSETTSSKVNGSNSGNSNQKHGAERLFQYFEADDSDPEDYARQLQMAAISRNTASVAQDFHNAGGGKTNEEWHFVGQIPKDTVNKSYDCVLNEYIETIEHFNLNDTKANSKMCNIYSDPRNSEMPNYKTIMRQSVSPPANQSNQLNCVLKKTSLPGQHANTNAITLSVVCQTRQHISSWTYSVI